MVHENISSHPLRLAVSSQRFMELEADTIRTVSQPMVQPPRQRLGWIPPPRGDAKGNVDGAISEMHRRSAVAAIFRSDDGKFLGASVLVMAGILDPGTAEAIASREALCLAHDVRPNSMTIASDCAGVVQSIEEGTLRML